MRTANKNFFSQRASICASAAFLVALTALPIIEMSRSHAADLALPAPSMPAPIGVSATPTMPGMVAPPSMAPPAQPLMMAGSPAAAMPSMPGMPNMPKAPTPSMPAMPGMPGLSPSPASPGLPSPVAANPGMPMANAAGSTPVMPPLPGAIPVPGAPGAPSIVGPDGNTIIAKNASVSEDKISDNAKGIMKKLDNATDAMTLEDLNAAQQTVARIEAMIDVEKHLSELEKIRSERSGSSGNHNSMQANALANAIPASALAPMPAMPMAMPNPPTNVAATAPKPVEKEKPKTVMTNLEISRITGAEGKYSAVLRMGNGDLKPVHVGDNVAEHATVKWISASSVLIDENGEPHTLHIKNVDAIFSAMK